MKTILLAATLFALTGCASVMTELSPPMSIVAMRGEQIDAAAQCTATNKEGSWVTSGNGTVGIRKSASDLKVECRNNLDKTTGVASVESSTAGRYIAANFILLDLCTISCIVDFSTGAIYEYPSQIKVPMAK